MYIYKILRKRWLDREQKLNTVIQEETKRTEEKKEAGYRSPTWSILRALQKINEAKMKIDMHIFIYIHIFVYVCAYTCTYIHISVCMYIYIYSYIYIHIYIFICSYRAGVKYCDAE